jgi:hypothetical protein
VAVFVDIWSIVVDFCSFSPSFLLFFLYSIVHGLARQSGDEGNPEESRKIVN